MSRRVHFSRLLDIMQGYYGVKSKEMPKLAKDFNQFSRDISKFRSQIDSNMPTFYLVDIDLIAQEVIASLADRQIYKENEDYVSSRLHKKIPKAKILQVIRGALSKIPSIEFLPIFTEIEKSYNSMLQDFNNATAYIAYRRIAQRGAFNIGTILKAKVGVASRVQDAHKFLQNVPKNNTLVFVGLQFSSAKTKINDLCNEALRKFVTAEYDLTIKKYDQKAGDTWQVGNLVNAGHTAAYQGSTVIGVNMPFLQEAQFRLQSAVQEASSLEQNVQTLYTTNNYQVDFKQEYKNVAQCLLDMQFQFVVQMPSAYNTNTLRVAEVEKIKAALAQNAAKEFSAVLSDKIKSGVLSFQEISASPTLADYLIENLANIIKGAKQTTQVKKQTQKKQSRGAQVSQVKSHKPKISPVKAKTTGASVTNSLRQVPTNLTNLQNLLNARLHDQIRANMGTGSSTSLLNYRSGRLAQSAKVERLSESRAGMLTAFYTYMKYPYATFSDGGRQQYPKSRDPKLLISKSIREIAGTTVANRMRAVNV